MSEEPTQWQCPNNTRLSIFGIAIAIAPLSDISRELICVLSQEIATELIAALSSAHKLNPTSPTANATPSSVEDRQEREKLIDAIALNIWCARKAIANSATPNTTTGLPFLRGEVRQAITAALAPLQAELEQAKEELVIAQDALKATHSYDDLQSRLATAEAALRSARTILAPSDIALHVATVKKIDAALHAQAKTAQQP